MLFSFLFLDTCSVMSCAQTFIEALCFQNFPLDNQKVRLSVNGFLCAFEVPVPGSPTSLSSPTLTGEPVQSRFTFTVGLNETCIRFLFEYSFVPHQTSPPQPMARLLMGTWAIRPTFSLMVGPAPSCSAVQRHPWLMGLPMDTSHWSRRAPSLAISSLCTGRW